MVTTVRCLLMYIVLPFVLPIVGIATEAAPAIVLPINIVAIVMIVMSIRRFWRADHSKRWWYTALGTTVIGFLTVSTAAEIIELFTHLTSSPTLVVWVASSSRLRVPYLSMALVCSCHGVNTRRIRDAIAREPTASRRSASSVWPVRVA